MAKSAKTTFAAPAPEEAGGPQQGDLATTETGAQIKFDNGEWRYLTPEELAVVQPVTLPAPTPAPGFAPAAGLASGPPGGVSVATDGNTAVVATADGGSETIPVPNQVVNMDGHHKEAAISLHSPTGPLGTPIDADVAGSLTKQINALTLERDTLKLERDRLRMVNSQLRDANALASKHIAQLQATELDSMGMARTPGL